MNASIAAWLTINTDERRARGRREKADEEPKPWLIPVSERLNLSFFRKLFKRLVQQEAPPEWASQRDERHPMGVPLLAFQRSMSRLFRVLQDDRVFNSQKYDLNQDRKVSWWEFLLVWKQEQLFVRYSPAERLYITLDCPHRSRLGRVTSIFVLLAIIISVLSFILSTMPSMQELREDCATCPPRPFPIFEIVDTLCVVIFTIEYVLRFCSAAYTRTELLNLDYLISAICRDEWRPTPSKTKRIWLFVTAWPNVIDLAAILPSYVTWMVNLARASATSDDSFSIVLRLIRLMRVVRAFRLSSRFEVVVIIVRSISRSVRAVQVLLVNLFMSMLVFGAVMFFMEGGKYNPETGTFERFEGWELDASTSRYKDVIANSPFTSIPECFWWALATATTVGYGDVSPTTDWGKFAALCAMIWSLCVLALPVGVIGSNFENVWKEYDVEKRAEKDLKAREKRVERYALGSLDPLSYSRRLFLEVYHDSQLATKDNDVFLGEVEVILDIGPKSTKVVRRTLLLELDENRRKSHRKIEGLLYINYTWTPAESSEPTVMLEGVLELQLVRAEALGSVDWKGMNGSVVPDPYVVVSLFPQSPSSAGVLSPVVEQFSTMYDEADPRWNETKIFNFHWHMEGWQAKKDADRRLLLRLDLPIKEEERVLVEALSQLQKDVSEVQLTLPNLLVELNELRHSTHSILTHLGADDLEDPRSRAQSPDRSGAGRTWTVQERESAAFCSKPHRQVEETWMESHPSEKASGDPSLCNQVDAEARFVVPGVVPD
mmetsp:Transcript_83745/g.233569  ORF Transcript_83745/g.233569 Transcript_83745/m.233569 type:complete len:774 (-) Transcript_83745:239-2560(-)|eukprot:CAMPEP_0117558310 /NCGR_PEP_ID=MMETSP0784-20121206/52767_1 /TAXON_ID=39447 /ORGANISM="" /LENGTH=773 /DNA_ID=CAMNT_0005355629 /DNA_START=40 /DNA_END=2361 /DNA_ORIENTATION=+